MLAKEAAHALRPQKPIVLKVRRNRGTRMFHVKRAVLGRTTSLMLHVKRADAPLTPADAPETSRACDANLSGTGGLTGEGTLHSTEPWALDLLGRATVGDS